MADDKGSSCKTGKAQFSSTFGNSFQANFLPKSSTNSPGGSHHLIHGMNMNNYDFSKRNTCGTFSGKYFSNSSKTNKFML